MAKILGVIGHPIEHSLSPVMHRAALKELGLDYHYDKFEVKPEELENFVSDARENFLGFNVTVPHKVGIIKFLDNLSKEAELIGAVNTVKFENSSAKGYNTDGLGALRALEEAGQQANGKKVLILGAGGASRAISFQLAMEGAEISICDKAGDKAEELAAEIMKKLNKDVRILDFPIKEKLDDFDILINATPVGMSPNIDNSPLPREFLNPSLTVMDIVYNPLETKLLKEARETGCKTVNGTGMLVNQGAESLRIWLGVEAPVETMRNALLNELKK
ncbi:MAG: shikimate dehydrogenase [Candidatus Altiarchaeales archaeon]|nr:shikimate dehydrogenase [Candidatus Altiarchaeota archaeon]MBU4341943.1 shikimate dehydrogenase [Candidatus Altiarchaeota archaeon]MCG2783269.1 shikimate dehydrogenase [Candidatus Altiarchaeales archaeon]